MVFKRFDEIFGLDPPNEICSLKRIPHDAFHVPVHLTTHLVIVEFTDPASVVGIELDQLAQAI